MISRKCLNASLTGIKIAHCLWALEFLIWIEYLRTRVDKKNKVRELWNEEEERNTASVGENQRGIQSLRQGNQKVI